MTAAAWRYPQAAVRALARGWHLLWFQPAPALDLAVARVGCFWWLARHYDGFSFDGHYTLYQGGGLWQPVSAFAHGLPVFELGTLNAGLVVWHIALGSSALGLMTRVAIPLSALGLFYVAGFIQNFGKYTGGGIDAIVLLVAGLALSRAGDYLSVDSAWRALREGHRGRRWLTAWLAPPAPSSEYAWPIRVAWLLLFSIYFTAGVSKLTASGFGWGLGDNMRNLLIRHHYSHEPWNDVGLWIAERPLLYQALGMSTLILEVFCPLGLFNRWLRYAFGIGLLSAQLGIWLLLGIRFAPVQVFVFFMVPWHALLSAVAAALRRVAARAAQLR